MASCCRSPEPALVEDRRLQSPAGLVFLGWTIISFDGGDALIPPSESSFCGESESGISSAFSLVSGPEEREILGFTGLTPTGDNAQTATRMATPPKPTQSCTFFISGLQRRLCKHRSVTGFSRHYQGRRSQ